MIMNILIPGVRVLGPVVEVCRTYITQNHSLVLAAIVARRGMRSYVSLVQRNLFLMAF